MVFLNFTDLNLHKYAASNKCFFGVAFFLSYLVSAI